MSYWEAVAKLIKKDIPSEEIKCENCVYWDDPTEVPISSLPKGHKVCSRFPEGAITPLGRWCGEFIKR